MKKIINGKMYDTEAAECVVFYWNMLPSSDFSEESFSLYRTEKGAYFIHGKGGPRTRWGVELENNMWGWPDHKDIQVISIEEARRIVEEECHFDIYERLFGEAEAA